ncbi:MAG: HEAT repeat domain-containing protein [candidate division Zixibacteria bacterium]
MKKHFLISILLAVSPGLSLPVNAKLTQETVDSMFVIASSGAMKYRDMVQPTIDDMAGYGVEIVPFLIDKLGTIDARERVTLRQILAKIGKPAVPLLNDALLTVEDSLQLSRVSLILFYIPDSSSVENLLKVKDHSYYWVRYQTIRALGKIGDRRGLDAIKEALQDENELVRTMAAVSAGRMVDDEELFDILVPVLDDKYYGVRFSAYEALKNLDCEVKKKYIFKYIDDDNSHFKESYLARIIAEDSCEYNVEKIKAHCQGTYINSFMFQALWKFDCEAAMELMRMSIMTDSNTRSIMKRESYIDHLKPGLTSCDEKEEAATDSR